MDEDLATALITAAFEEQLAIAEASRLLGEDSDLANEVKRQSSASGREFFTLMDAQFATPPAAFEKMFATNERAVVLLSTIVTEHGWPGRGLVGEDGADCAWMILQHADRDPDFRERCLPLLEEAVAKGDADPRHYALAVDRSRLARGAPQVFGSTWRVENDDVVWACGLEEPERLDHRRAAIGLPPFAQDREAASSGASLIPWLSRRDSPGNQWPSAGD